MRLFVNEKEVPALVEAMQLLIATTPHQPEAQELLRRIQLCIDLQCNSKTK